MKPRRTLAQVVGFLDNSLLVYSIKSNMWNRIHLTFKVPKAFSLAKTKKPGKFLLLGGAVWD